MGCAALAEAGRTLVERQHVRVAVQLEGILPLVLRLVPAASGQDQYLGPDTGVAGFGRQGAALRILSIVFQVGHVLSDRHRREPDHSKQD